MVPQAKLVFQSLLDPARGLGGIPGDLGVSLFDIARNNRASVHSNSWGAQNAGDGTYDGQCRKGHTFAFNNRNFLISFACWQ